MLCAECLKRKIKFLNVLKARQKKKTKMIGLIKLGCTLGASSHLSHNQMILHTSFDSYFYHKEEPLGEYNFPKACCKKTSRYP